jgi:hypothetical protein
MRREVVVLRTDLGHERIMATADRLNGLLDIDYVLDPLFPKPMATENARIYHLIKYDEDEAPTAEPDAGKFDDVTNIQSVPINDADALLAQGYTILDNYAKTVTLIKRREEEERT